MSQSGYTPILNYSSSTASAVPLAANLAQGELAINNNDGKLFYKDSSGVVQTLASKATGAIGGSTTQVQFNSSGALAGSANLTFNGTTLTAGGFAGPGTGLTGTASSLSIGGNAATATSATSATSATTATNLAGGAASQIPYQTGAGATTFLANGTAGQVLTSNGASAPTWSSPAGMTYPGAGIANSTGSAWGTSYTTSGSGTVVALNNTPTLTNPTVTNYTETTVTANTSTAYTIDNTNGTLQILTLTGNCTFTFPTATAGKSFTLFLKQDATGSRTVTWPASVKWPGGTAPTITATASKGDKYVFTGDGTYWWGSTAGQNYL